MKRSPSPSDPPPTEPTQLTDSPPSTTPTVSMTSSGKSNSVSLSSISAIVNQTSSAQLVPLRTKAEIKEALSQASESPKELYLESVCLDDELVWLLIESNLKRLSMRNCKFESSDSIGFDHILEFLNQGNPLKPCFGFAVQFNNCTTQWTLCDEFSRLEFNTNEPVNSLILILSDSVYQRPSLDGISSMVLIPSKSDAKESLSPQSKENLKSVMSYQCPNLKRILFNGVGFGSNIENLLSLSQLKLNLIYLWRCSFTTSDSIWSTLCASWELICSIQREKPRIFQFAIRINGHTTQVLDNRGSPSLMPGASDLARALILSVGQDLPNDVSLDDVSLLALFSPRVSDKKPLSPQTKQSLKSVMNHQYPNLKYLLLMDTNLDDNIEDFISISQLKIDLIYLYNCGFNTSDTIWSALFRSMKLADSVHAGKNQGFQYVIPLNGHIIQIIINNGSTWLMPNSSDLIHELILLLGQDLPSSLSLNDISFLALLPSGKDAVEPLSPQIKQILPSIISNQFPALKYLMVIGINFGDDIEDYIPISQLKLDLVYLWMCRFKTSDPIWSILCDSIDQINLIRAEKVHTFRFVIRSNGHTIQAVINEDSPFLMPNSRELVHSLIFPLGQDLPDDLSLDNISFLVLFSLKTDLSNSVSPLFKKGLESIMSRRRPEQKYLFLKDIPAKDIEEMTGFIRELELEVHVIENANVAQRQITVSETSSLEPSNLTHLDQ